MNTLFLLTFYYRIEIVEDTIVFFSTIRNLFQFVRVWIFIVVLIQIYESAYVLFTIPLAGPMDITSPI